MKKIAIYTLMYSTMLIIIFSLQYNEWFFNLFHPDWWKFSSSKSIYNANSYFWIWVSLNIFLSFFIVITIFFKFRKDLIVMSWQILIALFQCLIGIFLPHIYFIFPEILSWLLYVLAFTVSVIYLIYSFFYDKKALITFELKDSESIM